MDVHTAREEQALRRIVTILVALAALAEQAALRSCLVRWFVLWILRQAEAVAREFVAEATLTPQPAVGGGPENGGASADAIVLASRLRALAAALGALLRQARRFLDGSGCMGALRHFAQPPRHITITVGGWMPNPNDTS